jgi:cytochrome c oxidase subunit 1
LPTVRAGADYQLSIPQDARLALARGWLWLGMAALIGSGLFSVLLVVSRTPYVNQWLPAANFFHISLVLHVDLSVLVWFVAMGGLLWSLHGSQRAQGAGWVALWITAAGTLAMALAPFLAPGEPIMANYIPVLESPLFLVGLVVFGVGTAVLVLRSLWAAPRLGLQYDGARRAGLRPELCRGGHGRGLAVLCLVLGGPAHHLARKGVLRDPVLGWWTRAAVHLDLDDAGGVALAGQCLRCPFGAEPARHSADVSAGAAGRLCDALCLSGPRRRIGGSTATCSPGPCAWAVVRPSCRWAWPPVLGVLMLRNLTAEMRPLRAALLSSVLLFGAGGVIGIFIQGSNVRIPAHYHGCIVGVTLALMGAVYRILPSMGYQAPQGRMATLAALDVRHRPAHAHHWTGLVRRLRRATQGGG